MEPTNSRSRELRDKAMHLLALSCSSGPKTLVAPEIESLVSELQIYQMELELQNEELRITQHSLETTRARYQNLFESAPVGYMVLNSSAMIVDANILLEKYLNTPAYALIGAPFSRFLTRDSEQLFRSRYRSFFETPHQKTFELELKPNQSGTTFVRIEASHPPANEANNLELLVAVIDITETRKAYNLVEEREQQLRQAEKMEAIGHLAGGIAHDFNNILAAILGYADLSRDVVESGSELYENMNMIISASERARDLVRQILTFGRPQKGSRQSVYLSNVIRETATLLRGATPPSITFHIDLRPENTTTEADVTAIHEILMNLGTNAVYAMGEKGTLHIGLEDVERKTPFRGRLGESPAGKYTRITVRDTGSGMQEETMKHIFEPYFTTRKHGTGSGMGLSVVFGLVRQHDGNIVVESSLGNGSLFEVYIPKSTRTFSRHPAQPICVADRGTERILLVDDEEMLAQLGKRILEEYGYTVECHTEPEEALACFQADPNKYDLLITDQAMPHITGLELARKVKQIRDLPIVLCTGYAEASSPEDIKSSGIVEICNKPLRKDRLAQRIRSILDRSPSATLRD
ncbi:MAG: response regulator [Deltaproteobacteria bacterium]|nr:response regulator [Deltaproteobacteria bacterium]